MSSDLFDVQIKTVAWISTTETTGVEKHHI